MVNYDLMVIYSDGESSTSSISPPPSLMDIVYDLRCQSDPLRITRHSRVYGVTCCPVSEMSVALIMSDSRLLFWELKTIDYQVSLRFNKFHYYFLDVDSAI